MWVTGKFKEDRNVQEAISSLQVIAGWPRWFAKNIILWRKARRLPIHVGKAI